MKIDRRLGNILLSIYLILAGLSAFGINSPSPISLWESALWAQVLSS